MKTLELKDIAGYLPYGLNTINNSKDAIYEVTGISTNTTIPGELRIHIRNVDRGYMVCENNRHTSPILRPMSDLTKEIIHKGYNDGLPFVPYKELELKFPRFRFCPCTDAGEAVVKYLNIEVWDSSFDHEIEEYADIIDLLNLLMFDYRGLIPAGLAIDVNTLPENPYE